MTATRTLAAAALAALVAAPATAQLVTDTFSRTTGNPDILDPDFGSDWGSPELPITGANYIVSAPTSEFDVEYVADGTGRINFGRVILDLNLATADAIAAGGVTISFDVNPADLNDDTANGRDWAGIVLGDSNSPTGSVGGSGFATGGNPDARLAIAPRNSGSLLSNVKPGGLNGDGNPDGGINEPIFDQGTYDRYVQFVNDGNTGDVDNPFVNDEFYNVTLTVSETAPGNLFADGATLNYALSVDGDPVTLNQGMSGQFVWGDNNPLTASMGTDPTPGTRDAYLVFVGNTGEHEFDNLAVTLIPEPASLSLLGLGGLALVRRRR